MHSTLMHASICFNRLHQVSSASRHFPDSFSSNSTQEEVAGVGGAEGVAELQARSALLALVIMQSLLPGLLFTQVMCTSHDAIP